MGNEIVDWYFHVMALLQLNKRVVSTIEIEGIWVVKVVVI